MDSSTSTQKSVFDTLEYVLMYVNNAMLIDYCATECFFIHDFELACEIESN